MTVAVVIAARDAGSLLDACLSAVAAQQHQPDEIWVAIGPSSDDTKAVAEEFTAAGLRVIDNTNGDRASGLNLAIARSRADVIAFVDAQSILAPDYLAASLRILDETDAAVVGGRMRPVGTTLIGRSMALALQSPFGIGDSQFHFAGTPRDTESVYLGVYRRSVFEAVGPYNTRLERTEDDDLNWRVRAAGLRIWMDPRIRSTYRCREDLRAVWRQFYGYGFWKVALATLRPGAIRLRHLVPAAFVLAIVISCVVSTAAWWPALPLLLALYLAAGMAAAVALDGPLAPRLFLPIVTWVMHVAYGVGTLIGLLSWRRLHRAAHAGAEA